MIRKLISAVAVLAAMGSAHADADLSFYGLGDLSYGKNELVNDKGARFHSGAMTALTVVAAKVTPPPVSG